MKYTIQEMLEEAQRIQSYADWEFHSERELLTMSEKFYSTFGKSWLTII